MAAPRLVVELTIGDEDATKLMATARWRTLLRHIRVASKQELAERILAAIEDIKQQPVVNTWSYKLNKAA